MQGLRKKETSDKFSTHPATAGGGASHTISHQTTFCQTLLRWIKKFSRFLPKQDYEESKFFQILKTYLISYKPLFVKQYIKPYIK